MDIKLNNHIEYFKNDEGYFSEHYSWEMILQYF